MIIPPMFQSAANALRSALILPALKLTQNFLSSPSMLSTLAQRNPNMAQSLGISPKVPLKPQMNIQMNPTPKTAKTFTAKLPVLSKTTVNVFKGFGDGVSLGATAKYREWRGIGDKKNNSSAYNVAQFMGTLLSPIGRAAYAFKASSLFKIYDGSKGAAIAMATAKKVSDARSALRMEFRGGSTFYGKASNAVLNFFFGKPKTWEGVLEHQLKKYGKISAEQIAKSATKNNPYVNALAVSAAAANAANMNLKQLNAIRN